MATINVCAVGEREEGQGEGHVSHQNIQEKFMQERLKIAEILNLNCINNTSYKLA